MRTKKERLHDRAWDLMSVFVRTRDKGICISCGARIWDQELGENDIRPMNAGHFHHNVLDFDPDNINCQCVKCNKYLNGNLAAYASNLLNKIGARRFKALAKRASMALRGERRSEEEYEKLIEKIKIKIINLNTQ